MSLLLWCKDISLVLLIGVGCNAYEDCKIIPNCEMHCVVSPSYRCNRIGLIEVPSFPESTEQIDVSDNIIRTLNIDTFADYLIVGLIDVSKNNLTSVPGAVFKNNVAMTFLDLSNNFLASLPVAVFMNNFALQILNLDHNNLVSVPGVVFKNNAALGMLDLSRNNILTIRDCVLEDNLKDQRINRVHHQAIELYSRELFYYCALDLSYNSLTSIPGDVFRNNVALTDLSISGNSLTTLTLDLFSSNVDLLQLSLEWNMFTNLSDELFTYNTQLKHVYITGNPIDIIEIHVFDNNNNIRDLEVLCKECFDCDCLSVTTFEWITKMAVESERYEFTCRNGATIPKTVVNCSDDGLRLAVSRIQNESSCNCNEPISMKYSLLDLTTETNPAIESTIDNVKHKTKTKDSTYFNIALILSGIAASITLITAFIVLKKFISTTSRIKHSDLTDTEHNNTINDGYNFIKTIFFDGQMDRKYNNIPPESHMKTIYNLIDFSNKRNCNEQMDKERYKNIPPKSHMTLLSLGNIPYTHQIMVSERNPANGQM